MDSIADLLPFAVVIGYLFLKFAGRSRRPEAPTPPPTYSTARPARPNGRGPSAPSPFEELLARVQQASTEPRPLLPPPVHPPGVEPPPVRAPRADAGRGFDAETAGYGHERHGFGAQNPLSEPAFETSRDADGRPANPARQGYDPHGLRSTPAAGASIAARLASPAALRDAFVIQTILARRPALKSPRRPGQTG